MIQVERDERKNRERGEWKNEKKTKGNENKIWFFTSRFLPKPSSSSPGFPTLYQPTKPLSSGRYESFNPKTEIPTLRTRSHYIIFPEIHGLFSPCNPPTLLLMTDFYQRTTNFSCSAVPPAMPSSLQYRRGQEPEQHHRHLHLRAAASQFCYPGS